MKRYTYRGIRRVGKKDGRNWNWKFWPFIKTPKEPQPELNQTVPAEFEKEYKECGETIIRGFSSDWEETDSKLKPKFCRALKNYMHLKDQYKKESTEAIEAKAQFDEAAKKFYELQAPDLDIKWKLFWLILIGIFEFPLNGLIFSIFGVQRIETYIIAGAMCIVIPLAAHLLGKSLHQENKSVMDKLFIWLIPLVFLLMLFVIAYLRAKYFEAMLSQNIIGISITPQMATIMFLVINIAIFTVATIVSYEGSHPHHTLYTTRRLMMKEALKILSKESEEAEEFAQQLASAQKELEETRGYREKRWRWYYEKANEEKEKVDFGIAIYRKANMEARMASAVPECFKNASLEAVIPPNLLTLDWNCSDIDNVKREKE